MPSRREPGGVSAHRPRRDGAGTFAAREVGVEREFLLALSQTLAADIDDKVVEATAWRISARWGDQDGQPQLRGVDTSFRRIKGCKDMPFLVTAVRREVVQRIAEGREARSRHTQAYDQVA